MKMSNESIYKTEAVKYGLFICPPPHPNLQLYTELKFES